MEVVGQIIAGQVAKIMIREKSGEKIELGDLLVAQENDGYLVLQVYDLMYASQVPQSAREMLAGLRLEGFGEELEFLEPELRNYIIADAKGIAKVSRKGQEFDVQIPKTLPTFFNEIKRITEGDLEFLVKPENPVYLGKIRSGSKVLDVDVHLNCEEVLTHHVLVPATTGRGKSNLIKILLWSILDGRKSGILVLDPHDEYYGRHEEGLKNHPKAKENLLYYSPTPLPGTRTLVINLQSLRPHSLRGIVNFTDAQLDAMERYHTVHGEDWIAEIVRGTAIKGIDPRTLAVLQRKFDNVLGVYVDDSRSIQCRSRVFSADASGKTTIQDIVKALEDSKVVVIDTSRLLDQAELLVGSVIAERIFNRYQNYKSEGTLGEKPVVSVVIEEAPRVLGAEAGENIYSTIAREGRKFRVGLLAVTQLTSLIPRTILANINTKIVLGNEMAIERHAIIDSAAQDLSSDDRAIASLDKGEAIITSNFTRFAVPIKIPLFSEHIKEYATKGKAKEKIVFKG